MRPFLNIFSCYRPLFCLSQFGPEQKAMKGTDSSSSFHAKGKNSVDLTKRLNEWGRKKNDAKRKQREKSRKVCQSVPCLFIMLFFPFGFGCPVV